MRLQDRVNQFLYPELRSVPAIDRTRVLARAKDTPFDLIELCGLAAGLVLVTAFTGAALDNLLAASRFVRGVGNFFVALPLLVLALGPFVVRRTRRGLRIDSEQRRKTPG